MVYVVRFGCRFLRVVFRSGNELLFTHSFVRQPKCANILTVTELSFLS